MPPIYKVVDGRCGLVQVLDHYFHAHVQGRVRFQHLAGQHPAGVDLGIEQHQVGLGDFSVHGRASFPR